MGPSVGQDDPQRGARRHDPVDRRSERDQRPPFRRDLERVTSSSFFRRLAGVSHVVLPAAGIQLMHNPMTHGLKMAQIGRTLAQRFGWKENLDPDVVAAASLAWYIGHPPFGKIGREELNTLTLARGLEGFDDAPQAFRVVTKLSMRRPVIPGLDLTRATLRALSRGTSTRAQSPVSRDVVGSQAVYHSEADDLRWVADGSEIEGPSTEGQVVALADHITYGLHYFEDLYRSGVLRPIEAFSPESREADDDGEAEAEMRLKAHFEHGSTFEELSERYYGNREQRGLLHQFTSSLLFDWLEGIEWEDDGVTVRTETWHEIKVMAERLRALAMSSPAVAVAEQGQRRIVRRLFEGIEELLHSGNDRLPISLREILSAVESDSQSEIRDEDDITPLFARVAADFVASRTETQVLRLEGRLTGSSQVWA